MAWSRSKMESQIGRFVRQYGRGRGGRGMDPNDRSYDRELEKALKRLPPTELDSLLNGPSDEPDDGDR
jgi:hypothetical protein